LLTENKDGKLNALKKDESTKRYSKLEYVCFTDIKRSSLARRSSDVIKCEKSCGRLGRAIFHQKINNIQIVKFYFMSFLKTDRD